MADKNEKLPSVLASAPTFTESPAQLAPTQPAADTSPVGPAAPLSLLSFTLPADVAAAKKEDDVLVSVKITHGTYTDYARHPFPLPTGTVLPVRSNEAKRLVAAGLAVIV